MFFRDPVILQTVDAFVRRISIVFVSRSFSFLALVLNLLSDAGSLISSLLPEKRPESLFRSVAPSSGGVRGYSRGVAMLTLKCVLEQRRLSILWAADGSEDEM